MVSRKAKEELELAHCRTEKYKDLLIKRNKELTQVGLIYLTVSKLFVLIFNYEKLHVL